MKALLINGSPRQSGSSSSIVLDALRSRLGEGIEYRSVSTIASRVAAPEDLDAELLVLAFPLYIDSLPATLLAWLASYEELRAAAAVSAQREPIKSAPRRSLVAVANCGFYEGEQNATALSIVANFCARCGIEYRGGLGIGTGEMIRQLKGAPDSMFIKRPVSRALDELARRAIEAAAAGGRLDSYVEHANPRMLYMLAGHAGWRAMARKSGVRARELGSRPYLDDVARDGR